MEMYSISTSTNRFLKLAMRARPQCQNEPMGKLFNHGSVAELAGDITPDELTFEKAIELFETILVN
jgi:hypothetical protein